MLVKANRGFTARHNGQAIHVSEGEVVELPDGFESWLNSGLVSPVREGSERAIVMPPEQAVAPPQAESVAVVSGEDPEPDLVELVGIKAANSLAAAGHFSIGLAQASIEGGVDLTELDGVGVATVRKLEAFEPEPEDDEG